MQVYAFEHLRQMERYEFGSLPHDLAVKNIRLFAQTVLPALKRS
jgi:hypothetical protein